MSNLDLRRSGKFSEVFEESGFRWRVLQREGLWIFVEGVPINGMGQKVWTITSICQDGDKWLFARPGMTVTDLDKGSIFLDKARMAQEFEKKAVAERGLKAEVSRKEKVQQEYNDRAGSWADKFSACKQEQSVLIDELKTAMDVKDVKVISSKRVREIAARLQELESLMHHGRPKGLTI